MAEGVHDPPEQPAVLLGHRAELARTGVDRAREGRGRVGDDQEQAHRPAAERGGSELPVPGRLVGDPEGRVADGELGDERLVFVRPTHAVALDRAESRLVELDRGAPAAHRQLGHDTGSPRACHASGLELCSPTPNCLRPGWSTSK